MTSVPSRSCSKLNFLTSNNFNAYNSSQAFKFSKHYPIFKIIAVIRSDLIVSTYSLPCFTLCTTKFSLATVTLGSLLNLDPRIFFDLFSGTFKAETETVIVFAVKKCSYSSVSLISLMLAGKSGVSFSSEISFRFQIASSTASWIW